MPLDSPYPGKQPWKNILYVLFSILLVPPPDSFILHKPVDRSIHLNLQYKDHPPWSKWNKISNSCRSVKYSMILTMPGEILTKRLTSKNCYTEDSTKCPFNIFHLWQTSSCFYHCSGFIRPYGHLKIKRKKYRSLMEVLHTFILSSIEIQTIKCFATVWNAVVV